MLTASLAIGVSGISGAAPGGVRTPSGDSGAQRSDSPRVAGAVSSDRSSVVPGGLRELGSRVNDPAKRASGACRSARTALRRTIADRRSATHRWQDALGYPHTRTAFRERTAIGCAYLRWLKARWTERADSAYRVWVSLRDPREAICHVFGLYCTEALAVARCESGWAYSVNATNGQYLGLFQMGSYARSAYGHGPTAIEQARAAYRYFVASGRDWSPWSCKPR